MSRPRTFRSEDIPIPPDAKPHASWPPTMLEMAAHIGPYHTLLIVDAFAGQEVYIPVDASRSPFTSIVGSEKAAILSHVYGRERLPIPVGRNSILRARRQGVIALIREKRISVKEAAAILRMKRSYLSYLVNQTDEGTDSQATPLLERPRDHRQLEMFGEHGAA
jgi:hypothetical protein